MMAKKKKTKKSGFITKLVRAGLLTGIILVSLITWQFYKNVREPNVRLSGKKVDYIYIPTGSTYIDVTRILYENNIIINRASFEWLAEQKKYPSLVKPGKYKVKDGMTNNQLINLLRSGRQEEVKLTINKVRTIEKLANYVGSQLEAKPDEIIKCLSSNIYLNKYNKNKNTALTLFIPDTYHFYWNTSAEEFLKRMDTENKKFWNETRMDKAKSMNMSPEQVYTLASIVEEETTKNDDKQDIAGVYVNRLRIGMRLQADPTVKYAVGDFEIKRILTKHLETDSPFNTYKYAGLPPGPICIPTISSIDAVLNYTKHNYLYFCAKDDFSGYHVYAKTLQQHNQNADKYRKALNKNKIYK
jgi:UPF0755 protein